MPHSDFTLLIPLYDYHPAPALLAFAPPPWPQVVYAIPKSVSHYHMIGVDYYPWYPNNPAMIAPFSGAATSAAWGFQRGSQLVGWLSSPDAAAIAENNIWRNSPRYCISISLLILLMLLFHTWRWVYSTCSCTRVSAPCQNLVTTQDYASVKQRRVCCFGGSACCEFFFSAEGGWLRLGNQVWFREIYLEKTWKMGLSQLAIGLWYLYPCWISLDSWKIVWDQLSQWLISQLSGGTQTSRPDLSMTVGSIGWISWMRKHFNRMVRWQGMQG